MKIALSIPGYPDIDAGVPVPTGGLFCELGKVCTGQDIIRVLITATLIGAILTSFFFLGKGGLDIIQSEGKKEKLHSGRERVKFAAFGLMMVFLSFLMINILSAFMGFNLLPFLLK